VIFTRSAIAFIIAALECAADVGNRRNIISAKRQTTHGHESNEGTRRGRAIWPERKRERNNRTTIMGPRKRGVIESFDDGSRRSRGSVFACLCSLFRVWQAGDNDPSRIRVA